MSYLSTLIAAARGRPQGLQPRLAARFENLAPGGEPAPGHSGAPPLPASVPGLAPSPVAPGRMTQQPSAVSPTSVRAEPVEARDAPPFDRSVLSQVEGLRTNGNVSHQAGTDATPAADSQKQPEAISESASQPIPTPLAPANTLAFAPEPSPLRSDNVQAAPSGIPALPAPPQATASTPPWLPATARSTAPDSQPPAPRQPEASTIRISIGRIDVRADPTPAKAAPRPTARPAGESALTRYLNQRGRP